MQASRAELKPWLPFAQNDQTKDETEANVRQAHLHFLSREDLRFHIYDRNRRKFIGCTGLHRIDWDVPKFEIGYWIDTRYQGQGLMKEAVQGLIEFAYSEFHAHRIEIRCDEKNVRSRSIPERLDFALEGILRNNSKAVDGEGLRSTCIYAKLG